MNKKPLTLDRLKQIQLRISNCSQIENMTIAEYIKFNCRIIDDILLGKLK